MILRVNQGILPVTEMKILKSAPPPKKIANKKWLTVLGNFGGTQEGFDGQYFLVWFSEEYIALSGTIGWV